MLCPSCKSEGAEGKKYCADCGAPLAESEEMKVRQQVEKIFEEQFRRRDQKLLEIESADAIYSRLKKMAIPVGIAIAIASAVVGFVGYGKYKSAIEVIKATEVQAVAGLKSQAGKESENIRTEAANQRSSLQATAGTETTTLRQEASKMRQQNSKASQELQQQIAFLKQKNDAAEREIAQLQQQGTSLKQKYDTAGTQLAAVLQPPKVAASVIVSETATFSDQASAVLSSPAKTELRYYSIGSSGPEVEKIQKRLTELGCYDGQISGRFDAQTKASVEKFNSARGELFPSGVIDPVGWSNLFGPIMPGPKPTTYSVSGNLTVTGTMVLGSSVPVLGAVRCAGETR